MNVVINNSIVITNREQHPQIWDKLKELETDGYIVWDDEHVGFIPTDKFIQLEGCRGGDTPETYAARTLGL